MKHISVITVVCSSLLLLLSACDKNNKTPTNNSTTIEVSTALKQYVAEMGVGLDVDWSKTGQGTTSYDSSIVVQFKQQGLRHVRIRIKDDVTDDLLLQLDKQVSDCIQNNVKPVIAYQADDFKVSPNSTTMNKAVLWWKAIAEHFQNTPQELSFDLIIEVTDELNNQPETLNAYFEQAVNAIRESNPKRAIFISPRLRSDPLYLQELKMPTKHNGYVAAEWHFYAAGPSKTNNTKQWTTGTAAEKAIITDKVKLAQDWQAVTGVPTWVGAWMPGNYNDGNDYTIPEQIVFANFVSCKLTQANIPYSVNSDTKFYDCDNKRWIDEMLPLVKEFINPVCK